MEITKEELPFSRSDGKKRQNYGAFDVFGEKHDQIFSYYIQKYENASRIIDFPRFL